jgi:hypothetical protein
MRWATMADKQTVSSTTCWHFDACLYDTRLRGDWMEVSTNSQGTSEESLIKGHGPRSSGQACQNGKKNNFQSFSHTACCLGRTPEYSEWGIQEHRKSSNASRDRTGAYIYNLKISESGHILLNFLRIQRQLLCHYAKNHTALLNLVRFPAQRKIFL